MSARDVGLCPATGLHETSGLTVRVPHISIVEHGSLQGDWRFCRKCSSCYRNGGDQFHGVCARDHASHEPAGYNFLLPFSLETQTAWRFCAKCAVLFSEEDDANLCAADAAPHQAAGWFFLPESVVPESLEHQPSWRGCRKCGGLFFDGYDDKGACPRDGAGHERRVVREFTLAHNPEEDANNRGGFQFCLRCHELVNTNQPQPYPWVAPVVVTNAEHPVL